MLFVFLPVFCVLFDSSSGVEHKSVCYGKNVSLPVQISPLHYTGRLYFTPSDGGPRKLVMDEGKALDPRIDIDYNTVYLSNLNEKDDGTFSATFDSRLKDVFTLEILDCAKDISKFYGKTLAHEVAELAEFLEFTPVHSLDQPVVLWNRTDPQTSDGKRREVRENVLTIFRLTQADNGYYNFRRKDHSIESRLYVTVEEDFDYYHGEKKFVFIRYPRTGDPWTITFTPRDKEPERVMEAGSLVSEHKFSGRIYVEKDGISIDPLDGDSGTFYFRDPQGNLALHYALDIIPEPNHQPTYIAVSVGIVCLVILCCCCFCCIKRRCKKNKFASQTTAAPAVYYHGVNQPSDQGPSNTQHLPALPNQAVNSAVSNGPTSTSFEPLANQPVNVNVSQPEVPLPAHQGSIPVPLSGSNLLSSAAEPRFELKGLSFPSATPPSSDATSSDVYPLDKLNFL